MKKIELKQKTKELLKNLDLALKQKGEHFQRLLAAHQQDVQNIQNQKQNILGVIVVEAGIRDDQHFKLDENYDLIEVSPEEYQALTKDPRNVPLNLPDKKSNMRAKKSVVRKKR